MAKKGKGKYPKGPSEEGAEEPERKAAKAAKALLQRVRARYPVMTGADRDNRTLAMDDLRFTHEPGAQWDQTTKKSRGDRPCYQFNKLRVKIARVVNDMRANRPQIKVRPTEDADKDTADTNEGLVRNILSVSDADTTLDYAGQYQACAGMGAWRVDTEYMDESFDQEIRVNPIKNPFCLFPDPACRDPLHRDAADWILTERIPNAEFDSKYPKAKRVSFEEDEFDDDDEWGDDETTRICEYWYKEHYDKELWLLKDGRVVDSTQPENAQFKGEVRKTRSVRCPKIMMCIASGDAILEEPTEFAGTNFPFVMPYGEMFIIDGKRVWFGITRHAKDAQREYNVSRTAISERIALAPQAKFWATPAQMEGHLDKWNVAHKEALPFLGYNVDPLAPGPPVPMPAPDVPAALMQEAAMSDQDLKDVTGVYDPTLGAKSNETSGRAITRRAEQSELVTFHIKDNMDKAVKRTGEIIVGLIPHIYDTERTIRVLGVDGAEKYVRINQIVPDPADPTQTKAINDLRRGKFDVTITTGPSFTTLRQEAAETYIGLASSDPLLMATAGDLVYKSIDAPFSQEIAERRRLMLPPEIQQSLSDGKPVPPEVQAVLNQAKQAMQVAQVQSQLVQDAAKELEQQKAESEKAQAQANTAREQIKTEKARFDADVAKAMANIAKAEAQLAIKSAQSVGEDGERALNAEKEQLTQAAQEAMAQIAQHVQQFVQFAGQTVQQLEAKASAPAPARRRTVRGKRQHGGEMLFQIDDLDEAGNVTSSREARTRRDENGEIVGVM